MTKRQKEKVRFRVLARETDSRPMVAKLATAHENIKDFLEEFQEAAYDAGFARAQDAKEPEPQELILEWEGTIARHGLYKVEITQNGDAVAISLPEATAPMVFAISAKCSTRLINAQGEATHIFAAFLRGESREESTSDNSA